jgi:hypothetical protein
MLVVFFLGLIAKLMSVSSECDVGTQDVDINWNEVGISVLTQFLKKQHFELFHVFKFNLWLH